MSIRNSAAVVGVGSTPYYRRGESWPQTTTEMACKAILATFNVTRQTLIPLLKPAFPT